MTTSSLNWIRKSPQFIPSSLVMRSAATNRSFHSAPQVAAAAVRDFPHFHKSRPPGGRYFQQAGFRSSVLLVSTRFALGIHAFGIRSDRGMTMSTRLTPTLSALTLVRESLDSLK